MHANANTTNRTRLWRRAFVPGGAAHDIWFALLLAALASLPVLVAWAPQMTDYPSHLAGFTAMMGQAQDPWLAKHFFFEWQWTGNLGAEILMVPLGSMFGVEQAGRLLVMGIPFLTGLAICAVSWTLYGRMTVGAVLAFAMIWSPSLQMGFLNYSLSLALGLLTFAAWVRLEGKRWRWAAMIPAGFVVWVCHVSGWGVLGVMVFGYEWSRRTNWLDWRKVIAPWPLIVPLVFMLLNMEGSGEIGYGPRVIGYKWAILYKAMRSQIEWLDVASLVLVLVLIAVALVTKRFDGRAGWAALGLLILTLAVPRHIFGGDYADYRLSTTALIPACLAMRWNAPRWALWVAALLFAVRLSLTAQAWYLDGQASQRMVSALDYVPEGARVATAVAIPRSRWSFGPFEHLGSYAVVRRSAKENSNFALPGVHMLHMRDSRIRFADPTQRILYSPWQRIDLRKFRPARNADFLWYIGTHRPVALPEGARIIHRTPNSFLARLAKQADPR
jgi:hypothetical protein